MRILSTKKAALCVAIASLMAYPFLPSEAAVMPTQSGSANTTSIGGKQNERPVLVRNTTKKAEASPVEAPAKDKQVKDKRTISRCWKRLMDMTREIRLANRNKK